MIKESLLALKDILYNMDSNCYKEALAKQELNESDKRIRVNQPIDERNLLDVQWKDLSLIAKNNFSEFKEPIIPFKDDVVLCNYNNVYKRVYDKEKYMND